MEFDPNMLYSAVHCIVVRYAYIGPKSRTERPMENIIGTEVAHVTRDSDTTFMVKRSKVKVIIYVVLSS